MAARRSRGGRESVANGCARRDARGRIHAFSSPKVAVGVGLGPLSGGVPPSRQSPAAARQKASRSWPLGPHPSLGLGAWSTRVTRESSVARRSAPSASYRSAGTEPGGALEDDERRQRSGSFGKGSSSHVARGVGICGSHLPARVRGSPGTPQGALDACSRQIPRNLGATRRKTGPRGHRPPDGASNRYRPKRVRLTAHRLFASLRARTRWVQRKSRPRDRRQCLVTSPCSARNDVG